MSVAPLPRARGAGLGSAGLRRRASPPAAGTAGRRRMITWSKRLLPVAALLLLASVALWPEIVRNADFTRTGHRSGPELQAGRLTNAHYRGVDARNRPYTVTADQAAQSGPERIDMVDPKGDLTSENGAWTMAQSKAGVYMQHAGLLDMSGDVELYRDSGVTLSTQSAAMDLKQGAGAGNEKTHAEGPFGTLDAQGFALVDKGNVIQFQGASHLHLNGSRK